MHLTLASSGGEARKELAPVLPVTPFVGHGVSSLPSLNIAEVSIHTHSSRSGIP